MGLSTRSLTVVLENTGSVSRTDVLEWTINIPFVSPMAFSASGDLVQFTFTAHDNTPPPSKKKRMFRSRATPKLRGIEAAPRPSNPCSSTWAKWRVGVCGVASPSSTWRSWAGCGGLSFQQPPREKRGILCNNNTIIFILSVPIMASRASIYKQVASAAPLMSPRARDLTSGERHIQQHTGPTAYCGSYSHLLTLRTCAKDRAVTSTPTYTQPRPQKK